MFETREWKIKVDQIEDLVEDTIEFTAINTFIFNQTLSNGLTGDEIVTVINPLLTVKQLLYAEILNLILPFHPKSMALAINRDRAAMLSMVSEGKNVFIF